MLTRRTFTTSLVAGLAGSALPAFAQARKLDIGCTALIWGALPRSPENLTTAVKDMSELGYHKWETFASIVFDWDQKGTLAPLLAQYKIPLVSAYATVQLTDTARRKENLAQLIAVGQSPEEERRPDHGDRAQRREARRLQLRRAQGQHRLRAERLCQGDERCRPCCWPASTYQHGRRDRAMRPTRRWRPSTHGIASLRPTSDSCRKAAPMRQR